MLLSHLLERSATRFPNKAAAIFAPNAGESKPEQRVTFEELERSSVQIARRLHAHNIGPGDRVALISENGWSALSYFFGILKSGAENVDVPCLAGTDTILQVLDECQAKAVVIQPSLLQKIIQEKQLHRLPKLLFSTVGALPLVQAQHSHLTTLESILTQESTAPLPIARTENDVATIIYTSGTSGRPKGVMLSHANLISNITSANTLVGLTENDSILLVVPFYFVHGRMQILTHALIGGTIVVSSGFQFPSVVLDELNRYEVTGFSGVPYHFITLMERTKLKTTPLPQLKYVLCTGGALSLTQLDQWRACMPTAFLHTAYGQTEASPRITYLGPADMGLKKGSAGKPLPGVTVQIIHEHGAVLAPNEVGEVVASGPNIMRGYVSRDEHISGRIDAEGRLRTGDLGYLDTDGFLWLVGRCSDMIKSAGERIFPKEIEEIVLTHPAVLEAAAIGVKDDTLGERVVVLVALRPGAQLTYEQLRTHCLRTLPFVRVPRELHLVPSLPKTGSSKMNRGELQALYIRSRL